MPWPIVPALVAVLLREMEAVTAVGDPTPRLARDIHPLEQADTSVVEVPANTKVKPMGILPVEPSSAIAPPVVTLVTPPVPDIEV